MTQTIGFLITFPLTGLDASIRMRVRPSIATSAPPHVACRRMFCRSSSIWIIALQKQISKRSFPTA